MRVSLCRRRKLVFNEKRAPAEGSSDPPPGVPVSVAPAQPPLHVWLLAREQGRPVAVQIGRQAPQRERIEPLRGASRGFVRSQAACVPLPISSTRSAGCRSIVAAARWSGLPPAAPQHRLHLVVDVLQAIVRKQHRTLNGNASSGPSSTSSRCASLIRSTVAVHSNFFTSSTALVGYTPLTLPKSPCRTESTRIQSGRPGRCGVRSSPIALWLALRTPPAAAGRPTAGAGCTGARLRDSPVARITRRCSHPGHASRAAAWPGPTASRATRWSPPAATRPYAGTLGGKGVARPAAYGAAPLKPGSTSPAALPAPPTAASSVPGSSAARPSPAAATSKNGTAAAPSHCSRIPPRCRRTHLEPETTPPLSLISRRTRLPLFRGTWMVHGGDLGGTER